MYSSYSKAPKRDSNFYGGRDSNILTDHEALYRDAKTHASIQSTESRLTPLDVETILSNKGVVKYWYLHRPKTMEFVHKNAVMMQSAGRAFAVRSLIKKYGIDYMVNVAKRDAIKKEKERLAEMSEEERRRELEEANAYNARVEETRRLKREQLAAEEAARLAEEAAKAAEIQRIEQERVAEIERKRLAAEAAEAARLAALEEERVAEEARVAQRYDITNA
jgi:hypothetical protein